MAQITLYATAAIGNWDAALGWNTQADGLGTNYTDPQNGADTYICNLNTRAVTLNKDTTVDQVTATGATGSLTVSETRVLTAVCQYGGTATTGMIIVPTGTNLSVVGACSNTSTGYCFVTAGTAVLSITGACSQTSSGRLISTAGSGAVTITGNLTVSGGGYGIFNGSTSASHIVNGDITNNNGNGSGIRSSAGTITLNGNLTSPNANCINCVGGTFVWTGARSLAAATNLVLTMSSGVLNITSLVFSNSGWFCIYKTGGTITVGSGATLAQINLMSADAQAVSLNGQVAITPYSVGGGGASYYAF